MGQQLRYDYIIAGADSAGCALAGRPCEDPDISVCLIEAGGDGDSLFMRMPAGNVFVFANPKFDWDYESTPQAGLDGRKIYYSRGKGVGSASLPNGLIYIRGNHLDFDRWRDLGIPGWGYDNVLPYSKKSANAPHRECEFHGQSGPLKMTPAEIICALSQMFVAAAQQAGASNVDVVLDLPGLGGSLQDHPNMPPTFEMNDRSLSFACNQRLDRANWLGLQYLFGKCGPASGAFWSTALFHAFHGGDLPDLEVFCTPMIVREGADGAGWTLQNLLNPGRAILARGKTAAPGDTVRYQSTTSQEPRLGKARR